MADSSSDGQTGRAGPLHDRHEPLDVPPFPVDLGRFTCSGRYIMPGGSIAEQERREALRRIGLASN